MQHDLSFDGDSVHAPGYRYAKLFGLLKYPLQYQPPPSGSSFRNKPSPGQLMDTAGDISLSAQSGSTVSTQRSELWWDAPGFFMSLPTEVRVDVLWSSLPTSVLTMDVRWATFAHVFQLLHLCFYHMLLQTTSGAFSN